MQYCNASSCSKSVSDLRFVLFNQSFEERRLIENDVELAVETRTMLS